MNSTEAKGGAVRTERENHSPLFPSPHVGLRSQQRPQAGLAWTEGLLEPVIYLSSPMDKSPAGLSLRLAGQTGICLQLDPARLAPAGSSGTAQSPEEVTAPGSSEPL